jgi:hypothetical protein
MEIIVYDDKCQQSHEVVTVVNYQELSYDIEKRPEDYVFLLTPIEYSKYGELNEQIRAGLQGKSMNIDEQAYIKQYQGVFIIVALAIKPEFVNKYKIADMTQHALIGDNHAVFYINRRDRDTERAQRVLKRIAELKAEGRRHTEQ